MPQPKVYEKLAHAFRKEGTDALFTLMGDGNMHWATALADLGCRGIHVRHEHCAVAAATAYANATGAVGVASVTCGPGLTQVMTALAAAVRAHIPLVVFSGEAPMGSAWYNQYIEQAPFVVATGADYVQIHSQKRMHQQVRDAFLTARLERKPVVIGMPFDMQAADYTGPDTYIPSTDVFPDPGRMMPDPDRLAQAAALVDGAKRIVVLAGRGARHAAEACVALADGAGALLSTTLPVRGLFADHPFSIGIAGGFSTGLAVETFQKADLVIAIGASVTHHTTDGGRLFPNAKVIQIDTDPTGINQGRKVADLYLRADAAAGAEALLEKIGKGITREDWRTDALAHDIRTRPADSEPFAPEPGVMDPRDLVRALDEALPKTWEMVNASGHCSYFTAQMRGRKAENFHTIREFGAIGNGLSYAIGVAVARPDNKVVLFDGDGGLMMHAQELETIRRHNLDILVCVLNDGAFGSEIHKLRADGLDDSGAVHGRGDLAVMAKGFGLAGARVTQTDEVQSAVRQVSSEGKPGLIDFHISDEVTSPVMRKAHPKK
jgi:acetolactate synthase I/II/III large subunit